MTSEELRSLRSEDLLSLARNPAAQVRREALWLLVERGSHHAGHPDVAEAATQLILNHPLILKTTEPGCFAHKLPGLLEIVANEARKTTKLERKTSDIANDLSFSQRDLLVLRLLVIESTKELARKDDELSGYIKELDDLATEHDKRLEAAEIRLALLERSLWRKISDWVKGLF